MTTTPHEKIVPLEGLRGIASIIVALFHFAIGFLPAWHGMLTFYGLMRGAKLSDSLIGSVTFAVLNGSAAVCMFFTLSGFVLTRKFFVQANPVRIADAMLRRLPRMAIPVTASLLLAAALFHAHGFYYEEAARISKSEWLFKFALTGTPENYQPSLLEVFRQGLWATFIHGEMYLNSNLWTMRWEFYGSLIVLGLSLPLAYGYARVAVAAGLLALAAYTLFHGIELFPFMLGMAMNFVPMQRRVPNWLLAAMLATAVYGFGYFLPVRSYSWLALVVGSGSTRVQYIIWTASSCLMIFLFTNRNRISDCLSGRLGETLGHYSFTIYLVHTLLICSVGSYTYQALVGHVPFPVALGATFCSYAVLLALVSLVFVHFDDIAIRYPKRFTSLLFAKALGKTKG